MLDGPAPYYINMMKEDQNFTVDVYVNTYDADEFFGPSIRDIYYGLKPKPKHRPRIRKAEPDWHLEGLTYTLSDAERNNHDFNYTLNLDEKDWLIEDVLKNNKTAYVHMQVTIDN